MTVHGEKQLCALNNNREIFFEEGGRYIRYIVEDARFFEPDEEVHLVVTSPPYYKHVDYGNINGLECVDSYEEYLEGLFRVFKRVYGFLVEGGTICINISNMKSRQRVEGNSFVFPIVADIIRLMLDIGYIFFDEIIWVKGWANNGALKGKPLFGSYPYPPTPKILDSIFENILIFRKPGKRKVSKETKEKSKLTKKEWMEWTRGLWLIEPDRKAKHPATFPLDIPKRLVKLYSFIGDVVYDPFAGTGTTLIASWIHGRNSIGVEINPKFLEEVKQKWNTCRTLF